MTRIASSGIEARRAAQFSPKPLRAALHEWIMGMARLISASFLAALSLMVALIEP
jgi:hypothetical protein